MEGFWKLPKLFSIRFYGNGQAEERRAWARTAQRNPLQPRSKAKKIVNATVTGSGTTCIFNVKEFRMGSPPPLRRSAKKSSQLPFAELSPNVAMV